MSAPDWLVKLRILIHYLRSAYEDWHKLVWCNDLDIPYCCSGRECGCGGVSIRDLHAPYPHTEEQK